VGKQIAKILSVAGTCLIVMTRKAGHSLTAYSIESGQVATFWTRVPSYSEVYYP